MRTSQREIHSPLAFQGGESGNALANPDSPIERLEKGNGMRFNTVWREANSNRLRLSVFRAASRETLVTDHFTNSGYVLVSATVAK